MLLTLCTVGTLRCLVLVLFWVDVGVKLLHHPSTRKHAVVTWSWFSGGIVYFNLHALWRENLGKRSKSSTPHQRTQSRVSFGRHGNGIKNSTPMNTTDSRFSAGTSYEGSCIWLSYRTWYTHDTAFRAPLQQLTVFFQPLWWLPVRNTVEFSPVMRKKEKLHSHGGECPT